MTSSTHTATYNVVTDGARRALGLLRSDFAGVQRSSEDLKGELGALKQVQQRFEADIKDGKGYKELKTRLDSLLDTMQEYGKGVGQQRAALAAVEAQAKKTGTPIGLVAKAAEYLADEGEDAADVSRDLATALKLAAVAGIKTEDAGRKMGQVLKGDVSVLKDLSPAARRAAEAIEKIPDPAIRAKEGMRVLKSELGPSRAALNQLSSQVQRLVVRFGPVIGVIGRFAGGLLKVGGALVGGVGGGLIALMKTYTDQSVRLAKSKERAEKAAKRFVFHLGGIVTNALLGRKELGKMGDVINGLVKTLDKHRTKIADMVRTVASVAIGIAGIAANAITSIFTVLSDSMDGVIYAAKKVAGLVADYLEWYLNKQDGDGGSHVAGPMGMGYTETKETIARYRSFSAGGDLSFKRSAAAGAINKELQEGLAAIQARIDASMGTDPGGPGGMKPTGGGGASAADRAAARRDAAIQGSMMAGGSDKEGNLLGLQGSATSVIGRITGKRDMAGVREALLGFRLDKEQGAALDDLKERWAVVKEQILAGAQATIAFGQAVAQSFGQLASGSIQIAADALGNFTSQLASGKFKAADFAKNIMASFGSLFRQVGTGLILLGTGVDSIKTGITSPGALIAIGAGMVIVGGALEGALGGGSGGGGGATASAVQRGFQTSTDRLLEDRNRDRALEVNLKVQGFQQAVWQTVNEGADLRQIPALN